MKFITFLFLFFSACRSGAGAPVEIGTVNYEGSLKVAIETSQKTGKPIFLLFQEVPG